MPTVVPPPVPAPKPIIPPEQQEVKLTLEPNMGAYPPSKERERGRPRERERERERPAEPQIVRRLDVNPELDLQFSGREKERGNR